MLILLDAPNVLILDEPDNDLDIDMLAVVESLLDSWPGTLLLISHDRHLMERVTDDQFALVDGRVRHVPGGVDEYLRLLDARVAAGAGAREGAPDNASNGVRAKAGADDYRLKKELASTERKLETLNKKADAIRAEMDETDPSDYEALLDVQARIRDAEDQIAEREDAWLQLSELLG